MALSQPRPVEHSLPPEQRIELLEAFPETKVPVTAAKFAIRRMKPRHNVMLLALIQGHSVGDAGKIAGYKPARASLIYNSPLFQENYRRAINAQVERAAAGAYGAKAIFAQHAEEMALITVNLAKHARQEAVRLASAKDVLDRAGLAPAKEHHVLNVNELLDQMSTEELHAYVSSGIWPDRLRDKTRALEALPAIDVTPASPPTSPPAE